MAPGGKARTPAKGPTAPTSRGPVRSGSGAKPGLNVAANVKAALDAFEAIAAMYPRPRQMTGAPRKALKAAALLGDASAEWELRRMSENLKHTIFMLLTATVLLGSGFFLWQGCTTSEAQKNDLAKERLQRATELRKLAVERCRMTPDQAELAFPETPVTPQAGQ